MPFEFFSVLVCWGFPEKQNQCCYVCVCACVFKEMYFKELAHEIVGIGMYKICRASW